jgi:uncharacterized membrane protein
MTIVQNFYGDKIDTNTFFKILCLVSFLTITIDFFWIKFYMADQYTSLIASVQNTSMIVRFIPTVLAYVTIILPIVLFVIPKVSYLNRFRDSLLYGGILGACMYGMFSATNYALLKNWSLKVMLLDTFWGAFLYFIVTYLTTSFL